VATGDGIERVGAVDGAAALLAARLAVVARGAVEAAACARWVHGVLAARSAWTHDFGGEQYALGRAFYTHLETDRAAEYFADAARSDALVERYAPGLQAALRAIAARVVGARVVARAGWCGAGVHVFTADGPVARGGGVVHFDTEGLAEGHVARRAPALSLVLMLQPAQQGGGLRVWPALYAGADHPDDAALATGGDALVEYGAGDLAIFDSYRLHQIQPFEGPRERISATLHLAEIDRGLWESWF
jgi:hypothetical protein